MTHFSSVCGPVIIILTINYNNGKLNIKWKVTSDKNVKYCGKEILQLYISVRAVTFPCSDTLSLGLMLVLTTGPKGRRETCIHTVHHS